MAMTSTERSRLWRMNNPDRAKQHNKKQNERLKADRKTKGPKKYQGNQPGGDWVLIDAEIESNGLVWRMAAKLGTDPNWVNIKLFCDGMAERKANYWFGWNGGKISRSKDYVTMMEGKPDLAEKVKEFFSEWDGCF